MTFAQGRSGFSFLTPLLFEQHEELTPEFDFSTEAGSEYIEAAFRRVCDALSPDAPEYYTWAEENNYASQYLQLDAFFLVEKGADPCRWFEWAPLCSTMSKFDWDGCRPHGSNVPGPSSLQVVTTPRGYKGVLWELRALMQIEPVDENENAIEEFHGTSSDGAVYTTSSEACLEVNIDLLTRLDCDDLSPDDLDLPYAEDTPQEHFVRGATVALCSDLAGHAVQPSTLLLNRLHWYASAGTDQ